MDPLLALHAIFSGKFGADHQGLKVAAIAIDVQVFAGQVG
jgi:hypothetical protein